MSRRLELSAELALLGGHALRTSHRRELGFEQLDAFEPRPIARPGPDADVGIAGLDVDDVVAGRHANREFRMSHLERAQPPRQPGVRKGVSGGDGEEALVLLPLGGERRLQGIERLAKRRQQAVTERRQPRPPSLANEQRRAHPLFQRFHLVGNGGLRKPELRGGGGEALVAGRGFESADGGKRR